MTDVCRSLRKRVMRTRQRLEERHVKRRRVILFHIPKCAGISVGEHFNLCTGGMLSLREDLAEAGFDRQVERARHASFVAGHFGWDVLERIRGDALVFTVLRDPLVRLRSQYYFHLDRDRRGHPPVIRGRSFSEYLHSVPEVDNVMARQLAASTRYEHTRMLAAARLEALAIEHLCALDYVGFTETLSADLIEMCRLAGVCRPRKAPWLNRAPFLPLSAADRAQAQTVIGVDQSVHAAAQEMRSRRTLPEAAAGGAAGRAGAVEASIGAVVAG